MHGTSDMLLRAPDSMRLATWNVHKCIGWDGKFDPRRTARILASMDADVIALQEADERFGERRGLLGRSWLEQRGLRLVGVEGTSKRSHGWRGNVIVVSRNMQVEAVVPVSLPGIEPRGALVADMLHLPTGRRMRFVACHLGLLRGCRRRQAETICSYLTDEHDTFVMGDTNEWRSDLDRSSSLRLFHGMGLRGRRVATFPSRYPILGLDRIMSRIPGRICTPPCDQLASDHLPLLMEARFQDVDTGTIIPASA